MKKLWILILVAVFYLCRDCIAGDYRLWYESMSVGTSAAVSGTSTFAGASYNRYAGTGVYGGVTANYHIETFPVRVRYDGVAPTASEGVLLLVGDILTLDYIEDIRNFKAIGIDGTSTIKVVYYERRK